MTVVEFDTEALAGAWAPSTEPGRYRALAIRSQEPIWARVQVSEPEAQNPDYLLDRIGADRAGPFGRPERVPLPEELADGVALLAFDLAADDTLVARVELARRAWDHDIVVSARTAELETTEELITAMLGLLAAIAPSGADS